MVMMHMGETEKTKPTGKRTVTALGIGCIILVVCLGIAIVAFTLVIDDRNSEISSLNSQISHLNSDFNSTFHLLFSNISNLQNKSNPILNLTGVTFASINQINLDPNKWENKSVIITGNLSGPYAYPTAISYYYVLSSDATVTSQTQLDVNSIGVDFGNRGAVYNGSPAIILGVVKKGEIGTIVQGAQPTAVYYVEEQAVFP